MSKNNQSHLLINFESLKETHNHTQKIMKNNKTLKRSQGNQTFNNERKRIPLSWFSGRTALEAISGSWVWPKTPPMLANIDERNSWRRLVLMLRVSRSSSANSWVATLFLSFSVLLIERKKNSVQILFSFLFALCEWKSGKRSVWFLFKESPRLPTV